MRFFVPKTSARHVKNRQSSYSKRFDTFFGISRSSSNSNIVNHRIPFDCSHHLFNIFGFSVCRKVNCEQLSTVFPAKSVRKCYLFCILKVFSNMDSFQRLFGQV